MTVVPPSIDPARFLDEQLAQASPDLMREMLSTFINTILSAQADAVCGAEYRSRPTERLNRRNGYRHRDLDTRVGTIDVAIPKLREGTFFPEWLLARHSRAEAALTSVVATCYLLGVSTRRMDRLVQTLGITGLSKSTVSVMARGNGHCDDVVVAGQPGQQQRVPTVGLDPVPRRTEQLRGCRDLTRLPGREQRPRQPVPARARLVRHPHRAAPDGELVDEREDLVGDRDTVRSTSSPVTVSIAAACTDRA